MLDDALVFPRNVWLAGPRRALYDRPPVQLPDWNEPRCVSRAIVAAIVAAITAAILVIWLWLFRWPGLSTIVVATHGLVQPTLLASLINVAFVAGVALAARLTLADFGIFKCDLRGGIAVWVAVYCGLQILLVTTSLLSGEGIHQGRWLSQPTGVAIGSMIAQLFGTAVFEESAFRGFLFRQALARTRVPRSMWSYAAAAAIAAVAFSLWHLPQRLTVGVGGSDLALSLTRLWIAGIVAAYLYVRSRNLMLVMALHALFNEPAPLFASPLSEKWALTFIVLVLIVMLELRARRRSG